MQKKLTPEEEAVIVHKSTEKPFSGTYDNFWDEGVYACKRCGTPLYLSQSKFNAFCGWPSFDTEIPGKVTRTPDSDGHRTEITCSSCGAHLGHVFTGEGLTPKNTRHCVNSVALQFIPQKISTAYFGGGCFWCTEAAFNQLKGVISVTPGYAGGQTPNPTDETVSTGTTGHAEIAKVEYDPIRIGYPDLLSVFFTIHDPTSLNRQGADVGTQYRSIILTSNQAEQDQITTILKQLESQKVYDKSIVTEIKPLTMFYPAENYHRDYYNKNRNQPYCTIVISPKLQKLRLQHQSLLQ